MVSLWVALGSAIGGVMRYWCTGLIDARVGETFPWGTLTVNVTGSALIGLVALASAPEGRLLVPTEARQFVMIGVLGGFTTFSSFSLQTLNLLRNGEWPAACGYVTSSLLVCLLGVWLGAMLAIWINR